MLQHVLKRFLLSLPALWLLVTLVFLFSRLLVGAPGAEQILNDSSTFYSRGSAAGKELAYRSYLERTGQHQPLFYFSIEAHSEPDTLNLVYPASDKAFVQKLFWQYGNTPAVHAYFKNVKHLNTLALASDQEQLKTYSASLYHNTSPASINQTLRALPTPALGGPLADGIAGVRLAAAALMAQGTGYTFLFPTFRWHGAANQYHTWLVNVLRGNLGTSFRDGRPVGQVIAEAVANTWWLIFGSIIVAFALSFELGMLLAMPRHVRLRKLLLPALFVLDSVPLFLLALLLLVLLATPSFLQLFPLYGMGYYSSSDASWVQRLSTGLTYMALPAICLILNNTPYLTNLIYRSFSEESRKDYVRTARAKGLAERQIMRHQVLRNTLLPAITVFTEALPTLVASAIVVETIFAIPGMGRLMVEAVLARDYPVIVSVVMLVAVFRVVLYLLADVGYSLADPRIKHARA